MYIPFVSRSNLKNNSKPHLQQLQDNLAVDYSISARNSIFNDPHQSQADAKLEMDNIVNLINSNSLMVYYQPRVNVNNLSCYNYEALLRLKLGDGEITGPFFLHHLERGGMAEIIDLWVCEKIREDLKTLQSRRFAPRISINLHPDTLGNNEVIRNIIELMQGSFIEFEIIERGLLNNRNCKRNIFLLKEHGFDISIDDFGSPCSSFESLCSLPIDSVKLDKSIIDLIHEEKGHTVCRHLSELCTNLDIGCTAEGVETREQLNLIGGMGISLVQGYYFSPAIPLHKLQMYTPKIV